MARKNKIYWLEGVTEKGVESLLHEEASRYRWLRSLRNRRILIIANSIALTLIASGSYWPTKRTVAGVSSHAGNLGYYIAMALLVFAVLGGYALLRVSVRSIADAPDELLDERQIKVRNTSFRYGYYLIGYLVLALLALMFFGPQLHLFRSTGRDGTYLFFASLLSYVSVPSMVLAWRERDI